MKRYLSIGTLRKLNVRIIIDDNIDNPIFVGISDDIPQEISHLEYTKIKNNGNFQDVFVYSDEYIESKELEQKVAFLLIICFYSL